MKREYKKPLLLLFIILFGAAIINLWYASTRKAETLPESIVLTYQAPITIRTGERFPAIEAETVRDHCFALGYLHAMAGYEQMVKQRAAIQSQISELAGTRYKSLDLSFFLLNLEQKAREMLRLMSPDAQAVLSDYSRGINHWTETHRTPYRLRRFQPKIWQEEHSLALLLAAQWINSPSLEHTLFINETGRYYGKKITSQLLESELDSLPLGSVNTLPVLEHLLRSRELWEELNGRQPEIHSWSLFWLQENQENELNLLHSQNESYSGGRLNLESNIGGQKIWGSSIIGFPAFWSGKSKEQLWSFSVGSIRWELAAYSVSAEGSHFFWENQWLPFTITKHSTLSVFRKESPFGTLLVTGNDEQNPSSKNRLSLQWQASDFSAVFPFSKLSEQAETISIQAIQGWIFDQQAQMLHYDSALIPNDSLNRPISKPISEIEKPLLLVSSKEGINSGLAESLKLLLERGLPKTLDEMQHFLRSQINPAIRTIAVSFSESVSNTHLQKLIFSWNLNESGESTVPTLVHCYIYSLLEAIFADELKPIAPFMLETISRDPHWSFKLIQKMLANPYSDWWDDHNTPLSETMTQQLKAAAQKTLERCQKERGSDIYQWQWHKGRYRTIPDDFPQHFSQFGYLPGGSPSSPLGQFFDYRSQQFQVYAGARWGLIGSLGEKMTVHYTDLLLPASSGNARGQK